MMECERAQNLIDAHLDGELDAVHSGEMEIHLAECAACQGKLARRRALQTALRAQLPYYAAPRELRAAVSAAARPSRRWSPMPWALAACLAIMVGGLTWMNATGRGPANREAILAEMIVSDHLRSLQAAGAGTAAEGNHLIDVKSSSHHTVKPWFAGKLAFTPPVEELDGQEFKLAGGRLDVVDGHEAAALVYTHGAHTINLFVWPRGQAAGAAGQTGRGGEGGGSFIASTTPQGFHIVHWTTDGGMNCWAISDMDAGEMMRFARAFYEAAEGTTRPG